LLLEKQLSKHWSMRKSGVSRNTTVLEVHMTINIEWQDQFGRWHHYQTKQNQADAYRVAQRRAESTGKRHRLVDDGGRLLDLLNP